MELVNWPIDKAEPIPMRKKVLAFQTTCNFPQSKNLTQNVQTKVVEFELASSSPKEKNPFGHFNLGLHVGDNAQRVIANRSRVMQYIKQSLYKGNDIDAAHVNIQWLEQVHGNKVVVVSTVNQQAIVADASITREKNIALAVMTADCLPILLTAENGEEIAAIHGGWRSLAANIIEKTLEKMRTKPQDIKAWLGPCIGQDAFEVGAEVRHCFTKQNQDFSQAFIEKANGKFLCDLHNIAKLKLSALGINAIASLPECTYGNFTKYYSYRKSQTTGRMATIICRR
jgi:hypothetical protein